MGLALAALLSAAVLGATGSAATSAQGSAGSYPATAAKKPPASTLARQLAKQVKGARTPAARYSALVRVMRALHVPVFTPKGKVVVPGSKQLPRGFNLYDFELKSIASSLGRGEAITPSQLAQELKDAGLRAGKDAVTADQLRQALVRAAGSAAAKPKAASSLVPLLVRDLGLGHGYDLARDLPSDAKLDLLQETLVLLDFSIGGGRSTALRSLSVDEHPCTGATAGDLNAWSSFLLSLGEVTGQVIQKLNIAGWPGHAAALANGIKVETATPELQRTHFGPPGHATDAGKALRFEVTVRMVDDFGSLIVNCGPLVGIKVPKPGPVPDVSISWSNAENLLSKYGTISYDPANGKTGENGVAALVFKPKDEKVPGFGLEKEARGVLDGVALYQSAFGNLPGIIGQYLFPKVITRSWSVTFHKPRGFKFKGLKLHWDFHALPGLLYTFDDVVSGSSCGSEPETQPWQMNYAHVQREFVNGVLVVEQSLETTLTNDLVSLRSGQLGVNWYWELGTNPVQMHLRAVPVSSSWVPSEQSTSVPVEEDLSCPDNSGE